MNKKNRIIPFLPGEKIEMFYSLVKFISLLGRKILSTITPRELAEKRLPEIADYAQ